MEYHGKLYGKIGNKYFDTSKTSEDLDKLESQLSIEEQQNEMLIKELKSLKIELEYDLPENMPLYKDSGLWQLRSDCMNEVFLQQKVHESFFDFLDRCKQYNREEIAKQIYPDVEGYLDQVEHDRIQFIRGLEYSSQNTKPLIDEIAELKFSLQHAKDINEQLQFQYNELEKTNGNLKTQVDSLVHRITHLEKDKIPIVINSKHCNCREPKIYRKWGEVGCDKCGKFLNPNQTL